MFGLRGGFLEEVKPDLCLENLTLISQAKQAGGGGGGVGNGVGEENPRERDAGLK